VRRGTFAIIIGLIVAAVAGSFIGGRLSAQEILAIFGLFMLWAVGVSLFRGFVRLRKRIKPTRRQSDE
jgi:uncharacterized membrane protein YfcA